MAANFTLVRGSEAQVGALRFAIWDMQLDASYPDEGYFIDPSDVGLGVIHGVEIVGKRVVGLPSPELIRIGLWDSSNGKFQVIVSGTAGSGLEEIANGTNLSGDIYRILVIGS